MFFLLKVSKIPHVSKLTPLSFELKAGIYRQSIFSDLKIDPSIFQLIHLVKIKFGFLKFQSFQLSPN